MKTRIDSEEVAIETLAVGDCFWHNECCLMCIRRYVPVQTALTIPAVVLVTEATGLGRGKIVFLQKNTLVRKVEPCWKEANEI